MSCLKSAMYTTYVIHVKTAFHLRGVSRRFSDFRYPDLSSPILTHPDVC
jgi:hypothetical protein